MSGWIVSKFPPFTYILWLPVENMGQCTSPKCPSNGEIIWNYGKCYRCEVNCLTAGEEGHNSMNGVSFFISIKGCLSSPMLFVNKSIRVKVGSFENMSFFYDTLEQWMLGEPICVRTLSSHCKGPLRCSSIQQGVLVTVWRLQGTEKDKR